jgi:hypothetical protein
MGMEQIKHMSSALRLNEMASSVQVPLVLCTIQKQMGEKGIKTIKLEKI